MYTGRLRPQTFASFVGFVRLVSTSQVLVTTGLELELIIVLKAKSLSQICGPIITDLRTNYYFHLMLLHLVVWLVHPENLLELVKGSEAETDRNGAFDPVYRHALEQTPHALSLQNVPAS